MKRWNAATMKFNLLSQKSDCKQDHLHCLSEPPEQKNVGLQCRQRLRAIERPILHLVTCFSSTTYLPIIHNQRCIEVCSSLKLRCIWYSSSVMSWVLRSLEWGTHNALLRMTCNVLSSHTKCTHRYCTCWWM